MKRIFLIAVAGLIMNAASAQIRPSVPDLVSLSFRKEYPYAKHVAWTVSQEKYMASFESGKKKFYVEYDNLGRAVGQTVSIDKIRLPRSIRRKQERDYPGHLMTTALSIDSNNRTLFRTLIMKPNYLPQSV